MQPNRPTILPAQNAAAGIKSFLRAVDAAVDESLPADWPRVPRERLPRHGTVQVRHCFRMARSEQQGEYLAVVAVPRSGAAGSSATLKQVSGDLQSLSAYVIERGVLLLMVYEQESLESFDDLGKRVFQTISWPDLRLLAVGCVHDEQGILIVAPTAAGSEPLVATIRDLWSGALRYEGPRVGLQTVGVEIMDRVCWRCGRLLATVTGIVVPAGEEVDWTASDLADSQNLLPVDELPASEVRALMQAVDRWRAGGEKQISPIRYRFSHTIGESYWAATCPWCGVLQGAFPVWEERCELLSDGVEKLRYRELELDLSPELLRVLEAGYEIITQPRTIGRYRQGTQ